MADPSKTWLHIMFSEYTSKATRDTSLAQAGLVNFLERARNPDGNSMMRKIVKSEFIEASTFPTTSPFPQLVLECMNKYDTNNRCIRTNSGEVLVKIDRETMMAAMGIPHKEPYEDWFIATSYSFFIRIRVPTRASFLGIASLNCRKEVPSYPHL